MLEVAKSFPKAKVELNGFDIISSNFPAYAWLPSNIRFHTWDAFAEVPPEYIGVFDIVHIWTFYSCIKVNNVQAVLDNLLKLLKPGGYLQWDESDASTLSCKTPSPEVKAEAADTIVKIVNLFSKTTSQLQPDWLHNLPQTLEARGCEMVAHEQYEPADELARAWNDNMLLV